ncbi:MAG: hypothetical protein IJ759_03325 [Bacteroidales bacterium]|nr:hypothetical protein [Bacteroidales bacterium]
MPIPYYKVKQRINANGKKQERFFYRMLPQEKVYTRELAKRINKGSTLAVGETELALQQIGWNLMQLLRNGQSVKLDHIGTFSLSLTVDSKENEEDLTFRDIKKVNVKFRPDRELLQTLNEEPLHFVDLNKVNFVKEEEISKT